MKIVFGIILSFITIIYWLAFLKNLPHIWKVTRSKEWANVRGQSITKSILIISFIFLIGGVIGLFISKWSIQLLGIIN